ncbi:MAG TPA: phosphate acyltransferase PlsX, partial [Flavisolibacter sp.]|nr:phosphate acyltransferase PlsX [Flavisolibacter sp.]
DMMGGDLAPGEAVAGVHEYVQSDPSVSLVLIGDSKEVNKLLSEQPSLEGRFTIVHAPEVIGMHEHPTKALKEKPLSSIASGFGLLRSGEIDAFISAGNTGAMLVGALQTLKPVEGVLRPVIATLIPKEAGGTGILLDVGLNSDCKPESLNQFAVMGSVYAETILGISKPRVGLLNIGEEEGKGNLLAQATYPLLKENTQINFIGNIEGRDVFIDKADVMVCDGYTGNIILKLAESLFGITQRQNIRNEYFDRFNFESYGGTPILGVSKPVIIGHGISKAKAFKNMISLAQEMVRKDVLAQLQSRLSS